MIRSSITKITLFAFAFFALAPAFAQTEMPPRPPKPLKPPRGAAVYHAPNEKPTEKSIAVDGKVNVSLCVSEGTLKINGWERGEIRAFVKGGGAIGFNVLQKDKRSGNAVWVKVTGYDSSVKKGLPSEECLSGEEIEIDVPRGATVNVKGQACETTIDSVAKATIENVGGDIFLRSVERGIDAKTYEGDVMVENSGGAMNLFSTTGNIVAFDAAPQNVGDVFKAKTSSGAITLQAIEHRQMEIGSNSGSMRFTGEFLSGGQYTFGTTNGSISIAIPEKSSCKITASYGGAFNSEIPLQNIIKNANPKTQSLTASIGAGDAAVNLTTYSGAIRIRKR